MRAAPLALLLLLAGCTAPTTPEGPGPGPAAAGVEVVRVAQVDPERWSGEPSILALADGTLLVTGAGGMTRYAEDPAAIPGNFGQSYLWRSTDAGATWAFVDLGLPAPASALLPYRNAVLGVEGDLAGDALGRAYFVDLAALAANGLSVSEDSGATWTATQTPVVGQPGTDRPWVAALGDGEVWVKYLQLQTGHRAARSTDAGRTFLEDVALPECGQGALVVDAARGEVLIPCSGGDTLGVLRTPSGPMAWEALEGPRAGGDVGFVFTSLAVAGPGQYVFAWAEAFGDTTRVRAAASLDGGATWGEPLTLSREGRAAVFPWVDANPSGQVAAVWYEAEEGAMPHEVQGPWRVRIAFLGLDAAGLGAAADIAPEPIHEGAICSEGLGCVLQGRSGERRLLDFFEVDLDPAGVAHVAWTSTRTPQPSVWYGQSREA